MPINVVGACHCHTGDSEVWLDQSAPPMQFSSLPERAAIGRMHGKALKPQKFAQRARQRDHQPSKGGACAVFRSVTRWFFRMDPAFRCSHIMSVRFAGVWLCLTARKRTTLTVGFGLVVVDREFHAGYTVPVTELGIVSRCHRQSIR